VTGANFTLEEATALRDATEAASAQGPQRATLAAADRQARRALPLTEKGLNVVRERLRKLLGQTLKASCVLEGQPLSACGPMGMQDEMRQWVMGAVVKDRAGEILAAIGVSPRLGFHLIELAYGAPNVPAKVVPVRDRLTLVERETLWPAILEMALETCVVLQIGEPPVVHIEPTGYPIELGKLPTQESGIVQQMQLKMGEHLAGLGVMLTPKALDILWASAHAEGQEHAQHEAHTQLVAHLGEAEVCVVAHLGRTSLTMGDVANFAVGKTIWLDKTPRDPVDVSVEGQPKFLAMPMQRAGAVGVQILSRTS
jgi:flagellar motor switch/type III secretory pathway protein FliN